MSKVDFERVFASIPDRYIVVAPNSPEFTIVEVSNGCLELIQRKRAALLGREVSEALPENQSSPEATRTAPIKDSFEQVLRERKPHSLGTYRYDLPHPEEPDRFVERYFSLRNIPVFDDGEITYIIHKVDEVTDFVVRDRQRRYAPSEDQSEPGCLLLVQPEPETRTYLRELFSPYWETKTARSGEEAMEFVDATPPDLAVVASELPDLPGYEFITQLRRKSATESIPALLHLKHADDRDFRRAYQAGANDVISGEIAPREFIARVQAQVFESELQRTLRARAQQVYRQLFMEAPIAIALLEGPEHVYALSNPAHDDLLDNIDVTGLPAREIFRGEAGAPAVEGVNAVYEMGEPLVIDELPIDEDGPLKPEVQYLTTAFLPYDNLRGETQGVAVFAYDVTETVEIRQATERESARKDEFLAMLGHELRNPLTPIAYAAEFLQRAADEVSPEQITSASERIHRQVDQLTRLVDDLLDVARISQGHIEIKRTETRLRDFVTAAVDAISPKIESKNQSLEINLPDAEVTARVDAERITQVVSNLLANASKYTPEDGNIWLDADVDGKWLLLKVRDDGQGIDPEFLDELFEPFTQWEVPLDRSDAGLGLGLALVEQIVRLHDGSVDAYSEGAGAGSCFLVRLPVIASND